MIDYEKLGRWSTSFGNKFYGDLDQGFPVFGRIVRYFCRGLALAIFAAAFFSLLWSVRGDAPGAHPVIWGFIVALLAAGLGGLAGCLSRGIVRDLVEGFAGLAILVGIAGFLVVSGMGMVANLRGVPFSHWDAFAGIASFLVGMIVISAGLAVLWLPFKGIPSQPAGAEPQQDQRP